MLSSRVFKTAAALFLVVVLLWAAWWVVPSFFSITLEQRSSLGSMFGGINALFTGLALAALALGIILQREEIRSHENHSKAVLRQNTYVTMISFYTRRLEILEGRLESDRTPALATEVEVAQEQLDRLLTELQDQFPIGNREDADDDAEV